MRLSGVNAFTLVYEKGASRSRGPLKIFALPNDLTFARLGLSVSRRVGTAPRRNRIKRQLRETFRQLDPAIGGPYDFVIVVRPHDPLPPAEYHAILSGVMTKLIEVLQKRAE
jgi:ribonuclease P protein component